MVYLLDANVLIDANRDYYPLTRVPEFWDWLVHHGKRGTVKIPLEMLEEIRAVDGELSDWTKLDQNEAALLLEQEITATDISRIVDVGYAPDLTDDEVIKLGKDPFLIGHATVITEACVVTTEVSKPSRIRANRHIPNVCTDFGIDCCNTFELTRRLDFRTNWRTGP